MAAIMRWYDNLQQRSFRIIPPVIITIVES